MKLSGVWSGGSSGGKCGVVAAIIGIGVALATFYLAALFLLDVFSLTGVAYTFGLGSGEGLMAPGATRVVTLVLTVELLVCYSAFLDWVDADAPIATWRQAWLVAHVTAVRRILRRVVFRLSGIAPMVAMARRPTVRPKVAPTVTPTLQLEAIVVDDDSDAVVYDLPTRKAGAAA